MSVTCIRYGLLSTGVPTSGAAIGEIIKLANLGVEATTLSNSATLILQTSSVSLAPGMVMELYWNGKAFVELSRSLALKISLTAGVEGAGSANSIDVVGAIVNLDGSAITAAMEVQIRTLAVTADKGDLAAATAAVGTVKKAVNPATGENVQWMTTTSAGLFSFKVSDDAVEDVLVVVLCDGALSALLKLTFA